MEDEQAIADIQHHLSQATKSMNQLALRLPLDQRVDVLESAFAMAVDVSNELVDHLQVCPIHLERMDKPQLTPCGHVFCADCLKFAFGGAFRRPCPTCRTLISRDELRPAAVYYNSLDLRIITHKFTRLTADVATATSRSTRPSAAPLTAGATPASERSVRTTIATYRKIVRGARDAYDAIQCFTVGHEIRAEATQSWHEIEEIVSAFQELMTNKPDGWWDHAERLLTELGGKDRELQGMIARLLQVARAISSVRAVDY